MAAPGVSSQQPQPVAERRAAGFRWLREIEDLDILAGAGIGQQRHPPDAAILDDRADGQARRQKPPSPELTTWSPARKFSMRDTMLRIGCAVLSPRHHRLDVALAAHGRDGDGNARVQIGQQDHPNWCAGR